MAPMAMATMKRAGTLSFGFLLAALSAACTVKSAREHYIVAERLWGDGNYKGAAQEFERAASKDPSGSLGMQALFRASMTQTLFLDQPVDAVKNLKKYLEIALANPAGAQTFPAKLLLGEIMFSKLNQYEQVIPHYQALLAEKPDAPEAAELLFRIGKSHLYLWQFEKAVDVFQDVLKRFPKSSQAERAAYEIGVAYFTGGEQKFSAEGEAGIDAFQSAIRAFQTFLRQHPNSGLRDDAKLMMANCYEELDQLNDAYALLKEIEPIHTAKNLIRLRMRRIEQRLTRKNK